MSNFSIQFTNFIKNENKEIVMRDELNEFIVQGYDRENNMGIEFQNSQILVQEIISRDKIIELDWVFNVEEQFIKRIIVGNLVICEISNENWEKAVKVIENNVFLYTGCNEWIWLVDREIYSVEIDNKLRDVWIGEVCVFKDVLENTCLENIILGEGINYFNSITRKLETVNIIYARCNKSMYLLDDIHRKYVNNIQFIKNDIIAIKSVAGSGKTTTLLNLSKIHSNKKVLYIAFNKSLITEIKDKIRKQKLKNLFPFTFDALLYKLYTSITKRQPEITQLRPQNIQKFVPFLENKPYKIKEYYCKEFIKFCNDDENNDIKSYCLNRIGKSKPLLDQLWEKVKQDKLITFETIRKQAYINKWFNKFIDENYDLIMIDETQDFDMIMLKMLLNDTTIPKIFVGDPKQSIYDFRGCINAFNYLPKEALIIEFYSTFRVGNPACEIIKNKIEECWMISKSKNITNIVSCFEPDDKYIYLCRTWRVLLQTAETLQDIWIYSYDKKMNEIKNLHKRLSNRNLIITCDDDLYEDDLPKFLTTISLEQLEELLDNISNNMVDYEDSKIKFYTVHSYKGMEDNNVRLANDITIDNKNIYYVGITRGMDKILIDN